MNRHTLTTACLLSVAAATPALAADNELDEDARMFGRVLALVQPIVHAAAASPDPQVVQREVDAIFQGRSAEANRLAAELFEEILRDMPPEHRGTFIAIGRDLLTLARREQVRAAAQAQLPETERAIQARKDLHAMGLRYYDEAQYEEALRRGDRIAVELFRAAGGLRNLPPAR